MKITIETIKEKINELTKGQAILISNYYENQKTPLELKCACGNNFTTTYQNIKKGCYICKECQKENSSKKYRMDFEQVKKIINENGCEYINGDYINNQSKLYLKCKCGNYFYKDFSHFKRGQTSCKDCSHKRLKESKIIYTKEKAIKILEEKGITLLSEYKDSKTNIKCKCKNNHIFETKLSYVLYNKFGCLECSKNFHKGENANHYQGGENELDDYLRKLIKNWKYEIAKKYNFCCAISKSKKDLVVHHIINFQTILKDVLEELKLKKYKKIKDYTQEEIRLIENKFLEKHTLDMGVLLQRKIHRKFHSIYGLKNNSFDQFVEFNNFYNNLKKD